MRYDDDDDDDDLNRRLTSRFLQSIDSLWFRMRRWNSTCYLTAIRFHLSLPDDDEVQVSRVVVKQDSMIIEHMA